MRLVELGMILSGLVSQLIRKGFYPDLIRNAPVAKLMLEGFLK